MTLKTPSPWTAGRKTAIAPAPKVRCEGGKCTWSDGRRSRTPNPSRKK